MSNSLYKRNLYGDGCGWLAKSHSCSLTDSGCESCLNKYMTSKNNDWVQVRHSELLRYVDGVEMLSKDHTQLQQDFNDAKTIAGIIDKTWKLRLDDLMDLIIDLHPSTNPHYRNGLMTAYQLMMGIED